MDGNGFRQARPNAGRRLNHAEGAVGETQTGHRRVLYFDPLMRQRGRNRSHLHGPTHHPVQQIHVMNGLVHQGTPTVQRFRTLPAPLIVILLRSPPLAGGFAEREPTETPLVYRLFEQDIGVGESRGKYRTQLHPVTFACRDDAIAPIQGDFQRFLHDHVLFRFGGGYGRLHVRPARRADIDNV
ncbi:hypothetical protein HRbin36_02838 [bacterium HR36]|nr:hypothetical protein HRbin36_02838 [bacterium HR36]